MPGAHWGSQYQAGAAIFLSASKAREKTRSQREHGIFPHSSWFVLHPSYIGPIYPTSATRKTCEASRRGGTPSDVIKRMVCVTRDPQPVEKDSKFSGDRDDCPFLAVLSAPFEHSCAPAFKVTVRAKTPQQILSALNEQRSELFVAGLADSELLFDGARLVATWRQPKVCRYISGMREPTGVTDGKHVLKRSDRQSAGAPCPSR
jgi:hypothetical protein